MAFSIGIRLSLVTNDNPEVIDPLAVDFFTRLSAQSLTLSASRKSAYNTFFKSGRANGWLPHIIEAYAFEGSTVAQAGVKLIYRGGDASSLTNSGYVNGDINTNGGMLSSTAGRSFTTINANTLTNTGGLSMWLRDSFSGSTRIGLGLSNAATPYLQLGTTYVGAPNIRNTAYSIWGAGSDNFNLGNALGRGLYRVGRSALNSQTLRINNLLQGTKTNTIANTRRNAVMTVAESPLPMDFGAIDDGTMSAGEAVSFTQDVATLMWALGRRPVASEGTNFALIVGQSLSIGTGGTTILSTDHVATYGNRQPFYSTLQSADSSKGTAPVVFGGLFEINPETIASELANTNSKLRRATLANAADYDMVVSNWGSGGAGYTLLKKGTTVYNNSLAAVTDGRALHLITESGTFRVPAVTAVHGETDSQSATYQANIEEWQTDYETDIKAITGQTGIIPMLHSQPSAWTSTLSSNLATALSPHAILAAHEAAPTKHVLVCPKYFLPYSDGLHLTNVGYRLLGAYYGKALNAIMAGGTYLPLKPVSAVRTGAVIVLTVAGRVGDLVLDTTTVSDPGNYGFEWAQTGGSAVTISSVALINSNTQVQITLSGDPGSPSVQKLRYAFTGTAGNNGGPTTGPRGCLRDSDTTAGYSAGALPDWMVHFDLPVT